MICLDSNVLPQVIIPGQPKLNSVLKYLMSLEEPAALSITAAIVLLKLGRQAGISDRTLHRAIAEYRLLPVLPKHYTSAIDNEANGDFHGALQVAIAVQEGCEQFITTDQQRASRYSHLIDIVTL